MDFFVAFATSPQAHATHALTRPRTRGKRHFDSFLHQPGVARSIPTYENHTRLHETNFLTQGRESQESQESQEERAPTLRPTEAGRREGNNTNTHGALKNSTKITEPKHHHSTQSTQPPNPTKTNTSKRLYPWHRVLRMPLNSIRPRPQGAAPAPLLQHLPRPFSFDGRKRRGHHSLTRKKTDKSNKS